MRSTIRPEIKLPEITIETLKVTLEQLQNNEKLRQRSAENVIFLKTQHPKIYEEELTEDQKAYGEECVKEYYEKLRKQFGVKTFQERFEENYHLKLPTNE